MLTAELFYFTPYLLTPQLLTQLAKVELKIKSGERRGVKKVSTKFGSLGYFF